LAETIESVRAQDYPRIEHLVMDGGSTDGTLGILKRYADGLIWVSQPDEGQSDAINEGFRRAHGEILAWLNADDTYFPWTVRTAVEALAQHPDAGMIYGSTVLIDARGETIDERPAQPFDLQRLLDEGDYISQPTVFMRRRALDEVAPLRTELHYCMDYDLWLRIARRFPVRVVAQPPLARYRLHEASKTTYIPYAMVQERYAISGWHGGDAIRGALNVLFVKWSIHASEEFASGPGEFKRTRLGDGYLALPLELRRQARPVLADVYIQAGFHAYQAGDLAAASEWFQAALRLDLRWLRNRGVLSVLVRSLLHRIGLELPHLRRLS
jgi:hypothetical protein